MNQFKSIHSKLMSKHNLKKKNTQHTDTLHLHSFIKWKYNHTRSTHCSALLKMLINEPFHANGFFKKEKKTTTGRQIHKLITKHTFSKPACAIL